jgi:hypothetical protein
MSSTEWFTHAPAARIGTACIARSTARVSQCVFMLGRCSTQTRCPLPVEHFARIHRTIRSYRLSFPQISPRNAGRKTDVGRTMHWASNGFAINPPAKRSEGDIWQIDPDEGGGAACRWGEKIKPAQYIDLLPRFRGRFSPMFSSAYPKSGSRNFRAAPGSKSLGGPDPKNRSALLMIGICSMLLKAKDTTDVETASKFSAEAGSS